MNVSPVATLVIEFDAVLDAAENNSGQLDLLVKLSDYANTNLIEIVLICNGHAGKINNRLEEISFPKPMAIINLEMDEVCLWRNEGWLQVSSDLFGKATPVCSWLNEKSDKLPVILMATSSVSISLAQSLELNVAVVPSVCPTLAHKLYLQRRDRVLLDRFYLAQKEGVAGVFESLHWFEALPAGAEEYSRSPEIRLGAFSVSRDTARIAVKCWAKSMELVVKRNGWRRSIAMSRADDRTFVANVNHFQPGDRYAFAIEGNHEKLYSDPRSRFQPSGVHASSCLVGPNQYPWRDLDWSGISLSELVIYELHIGTFTADGTFLSAIEKLPELVELGITAIELMPVGESAGRWNWGYDAVNLFASYHQYGTPDDLKMLVDHCHQLGLAVILDVVYNHPGPEGNYLAKFGPYFSTKHDTPWGPAYNFDGRDRKLCRQYVLDNVVYWLDEFHFDGLRFDAIHFMFDESSPPIIAEITKQVRQLEEQNRRPYLLIGESNIFDGNLIRPVSNGGIGFDAIWCDDIMHSIYSVGSPETQLTERRYQQHSDVDEALRYGYLYEGPPNRRVKRPPGKNANLSHLKHAIVALQTHDSVGNHPFGKRLHHLAGHNFQKTSAAICLLYPAIPMIFMGDESLEPNPFCYFVDFHDPWLRDVVARSRSNEHPQQDWSDAVSPLSEFAFSQSKLTPLDGPPNRDERAAMRQWYRQLLQIRKDWLKSGLLNWAHMKIKSLPEHGFYSLVYRSGKRTGTVAVRLSHPEKAQDVMSLKIRGKLLADSLKNLFSGQVSLRPNHAVVIAGEITEIK